MFPFELQFRIVGMKMLGGKNALDLWHLKTCLWFLIYRGAIPKQPAITRQTLKDISNECM